MTDDTILIAADAAGGWLRFRRKRQHVLTACANCGTTLQGPWCHVCGQSGEDFHRSITRLAGEAFESLFHFDGRVWRTLPDLMLRPERLTNRFLAGHRAPQIPPLRLFLVVLLLVFVTGPSLEHAHFAVINIGSAKTGDAAAKLADKQVADINKQIAAGFPSDQSNAELSEANREIRQELGAVSSARVRAGSIWLLTRVKAVFGDPERFFLILGEWGERFALLALPVSTLLMSALFVFHRRFFVFDHAIFSLHSLSASGLLLSVIFLLDRVIGGHAAWLLLAAPVHLFRHMRGVYGTGVIGTLVRMAFLFAGSVIGFGLILAGLLAIGLNGMGAR